MVRLYGNPQKFVRHVSEETVALQQNAVRLLNFWHTDTTVSRSDGDDVEHTSGGIPMNVGSRVTKHKVDITINPNSTDAQRVYIGRLKLSFHDVLAEPVCGMQFDAASYQDVTTPITGSTVTTAKLGFWPDKDKKKADWSNTNYTSQDIEDYLLDDRLKHFLNLKKLTVFTDNPLIGERWQRIPSKCKRINDYTWYGLFLFNDSDSANNVDITLKQYVEEWAI